MKNSKIINLILILIILLNVILMTLLLIDKDKHKDVYKINIANYKEFISVYGDEKIGEYYKKFIQKWIEETMPSIYNDVKDLDEKELKEYYNKQENVLKTSAGIQNYNDFKDLVLALDMYRNVDVKYKKVEVVKNSCKKNENYTDSVVKIKYEGNRVLKLNISIMNYELIARSAGDVDLYKVSLNNE